MSMADESVFNIREAQDGTQIGFRLRGDEFLHWFEDTTGNPVIMDDDNRPQYAEWDRKSRSFVVTEPVTKESRRRHLQRISNSPSLEDRYEARLEASTSGYPANSIADANNATNAMVKSFSGNPIVASPGTGPNMPRPIIVIYVRFSADSGPEIPDSYIQEIFFDKTKFGTLAHYFDVQFEGAVQISSLGIYHVVLPGSGRAYGKSGSGKLDVKEVFVPAINSLFDNQGVDFRSFGTTRPGSATKYRIDAASCTPVFILHGQEEAGGYSSATSVWAHAFFYTDLFIKSDGHATTDANDPSNVYSLYSSVIMAAFHGSEYFTLGTLAHECGHALFYLPDLYDTRTSYSTDDYIRGVGDWSLMSSGWTWTPSRPQHGSTPPNLDGYSIWEANHKLVKAVMSSGSYVLNNPFRPHSIRIPGVPAMIYDTDEETFFVQSRSLTGYDEGAVNAIKNRTGVAPQPGVLIIHFDPYEAGNNYGKSMMAAVIEAHGGTQHLRVDTKTSSDWNTGDAGDLFGPSKRSFGDSVSDPSSKLTGYDRDGSPCKFDMTNIIGNADGTGSYNIVFHDTDIEDPHWENGLDDPVTYYPPILESLSINITGDTTLTLDYGSGGKIELVAELSAIYSDGSIESISTLDYDWSLDSSYTVPSGLFFFGIFTEGRLSVSSSTDIGTYNVPIVVKAKHSGLETTKNITLTVIIKPVVVALDVKITGNTVIATEYGTPATLSLSVNVYGTYNDDESTVALLSPTEYTLDWSVLGSLPSGFSFSDGVLTIDATGDSGTYTIPVTVTATHKSLSETDDATLTVLRPILLGLNAELSGPNSLFLWYKEVGGVHLSVKVTGSYDDGTNRVLQTNDCDIVWNIQGGYTLPAGFTFSNGYLSVDDSIDAGIYAIPVIVAVSYLGMGTVLSTTVTVTIAKKPFRHAIAGGVLSGKLSEKPIFIKPCMYPFSILQVKPVIGSCINNKSGNLTVATEQHIFTARVVSHRLVSMYNGNKIGEGLDIYVGKVLSGTPKVVNVTFFNDDMALTPSQLCNIKIEIVANSNYPYYSLAALSLDGSTWERSISYIGTQLLSTQSGAPESLCSFSFFARVSTTSTITDPKPIQVKTTYTRVIS